MSELTKVRVTFIKFYVPVDFIQSLITIAKVKLGAQRMSVRHGVINNGKLLRQHYIFVAENLDEKKKEEFERELAELAVEFGIKNYSTSYEPLTTAEAQQYQNNE